VEIKKNGGRKVYMLENEGSGHRIHEDFFSVDLSCFRASMSRLVIRVPKRTSQCTKNGCEKFDLIPTTYG
jgi:hypothetical protein